LVHKTKNKMSQIGIQHSETGKLAKQADGSVVVRMGNTMLLATVCAKKEVGENVDFLTNVR
jgi:polyribonucleotide nucleotidyltransferase